MSRSERPSRRHILAGLAAGLTLSAQARAQMLRPLAPMTDGPYYPPRRWREQIGAWDSDLTRVQRGAITLRAKGEYLLLELVVVDRAGSPLPGAEVEIWQCDIFTYYHHPNVVPEAGKSDEGFAGSGRAISGQTGAVRFRTIRPVPYAGNSPHIHLKVRHEAFGALTSRLWVDGDPGNAHDFNWVQTDPADRPGLAFKMKPAAAGSGVRWQASHRIVMPV